jgi:ABC-type transport system substrate-binding protein
VTFQLEEGVRWHDGEPFTAADVKCTFDLVSGLAKSDDFRKNPRKVWYFNVPTASTCSRSSISSPLGTVSRDLNAFEITDEIKDLVLQVRAPGRFSATGQCHRHVPICLRR